LVSGREKTAEHGRLTAAHHHHHNRDEAVKQKAAFGR
jgi:hypothetical protein